MRARTRSTTEPGPFAYEPQPHLCFESDGHVYTDLGSGELLPSVTRIIAAAGLGMDYSRVRAHVLRQAAARGRALHAGARLILEGRLDWETVHPRIRPTLERFGRFAQEAALVPWNLETPIMSEALGFACTPDFWGSAYRAPSVLEFKPDLSRAQIAAAGLQTAGQRIAVLERLLAQGFRLPAAPRRYVVQLHPDRPVQAAECQDRRDEARFLEALAAYRYQEKQKEDQR